MSPPVTRTATGQSYSPSSPSGMKDARNPSPSKQKSNVQIDPSALAALAARGASPKTSSTWRNQSPLLFSPAALLTLAGCAMVEQQVKPEIPAQAPVDFENQTPTDPVDQRPTVPLEQTPANRTRKPEDSQKSNISKYDPKRDPFASNPRIQLIAREIRKLDGDPVENMFNRLKVEGPEGLVYVATHDYGLTGAETLISGGDCSDFSNLSIAVIKEMNRQGAKIQGGAYEIHFHNKPPDEVHVIPFVYQGGKKVIVDLQGANFGQTENTRYKINLSYPSFDHAAAIYHMEWGMYFNEKGDGESEIQALTRSLEIFGKDPLVRFNLAAAHYNRLSRLSTKAFRERRWDDCIHLKTDATIWLKKMKPKKRGGLLKTVLKNIETCKANKAKDERKLISGKLNGGHRPGRRSTCKRKMERLHSTLSRGPSMEWPPPKKQKDRAKGPRPSAKHRFL